MEAPDVKPLAALADVLDREATSFGFFQAVRVLERLRPDRTPVGGFGDPKHEVVRFAAHPSLAFPPSEIRSLQRADDDAPAQMVVNFMGLTGPMGVLPLHYTQLVAERTRARDTALRDFLDLFHHRAISLFYQAWARTRGGSGSTGALDDDRMRHHLLDLIGLGTEGLANSGVSAASLLAYVGLLGVTGRSAVALEALLSDFFGVQAEVEQFIGGWYPLDRSAQCALGEDWCESTQLGLSAVVGDEVWDPQARARIRLGPLTREQYNALLPGAAGYRTLQNLVSFFSGNQLDFELQLVLARDEVPASVLGSSESAAPTLGWCSWLRTEPLTHDPDDTVLPLTSA